MIELLTSAQMRAIESAAIDSGAVTGLELMERAGRGVVEAVFAEWPALARAPHKAVVLCGPGNNGGDGFVIARRLVEWGWRVDVFLFGDPDRLPEDARASHARFLGQGGAVAAWDGDEVAGIEADLVVDAVFGGGLSRPPPAEVRAALAALHRRGRDRGAAIPLVAVDGPSGICLTSGRALAADGQPPGADLSVTFHRLRLGHCLADGAQCSGRVVVVDIGLEPWHAAGDGGVRTVAAVPAALNARGIGANKYSHGHVLVLSGGAGRTGAARLAARAALRVGAGLVTLGVPPDALPEVAAQITAVMCAPLADAAALAACLEDPRIGTLCLGPGLGIERARALVPVCLGAGQGKSPRRRVVLDADALTAYAEAPQKLFDMLHPDCVLTPHAGEFARLFPDIFEACSEAPARGPACSKVDAARAAATRAGSVVLFKGADTVIADPSGRAVVHAAVRDRAAPWLATAGSGDVLAGMIAGLLARGLAPMAAAETAAWLHVEAARAFGPGLIAEDLPEMLPRVFRDLGV